jgi:hypothetical protein
MISTYHSYDTRNVTVTGKEQVKPTSALDHTQCSGGVDLMDQLLHSYLTDQKKNEQLAHEAVSHTSEYVLQF